MEKALLWIALEKCISMLSMQDCRSEVWLRSVVGLIGGVGWGLGIVWINDVEKALL